MYNDKYIFVYRLFIIVFIFIIELLKIIYICFVKILFFLDSLFYSCILYVFDVFSLIVNYSVFRGKIDREFYMLLLYLNKYENFRVEVKKKKKSMIERKYNNFYILFCILYGNGNCWVGYLKFFIDCESI